ncbi:DUF1049 domain-containing protein [Rhodoblastus acidophilus]|jgi:uncharacterized integral membrane protein|uniref:DUF1049 domain-containing protein n=1 Tax=Rhodoblastus acidophilus TaxID=1074 RepID=A0A6N8DIA4_RHOAC|nr:LapA family protein [Rhodoblastus acidophilus]MCW2273309.1 putative integral membrane protein [Rhodoblastus acidophilus]MTV30200.1 DUF1049 domain-containing protein [Rhodoblastus acidophilus]
MAMRALFRILVIAPFALLLLGFSLANRQSITVLTEPFNVADGAWPTFTLPLYLVVLGAMMIGVLIGGSSTWLRQGRHRKAAREAFRKSAALKAENDALRGQTAPASSGVPASRNA